MKVVITHMKCYDLFNVWTRSKLEKRRIDYSKNSYLRPKTDINSLNVLFLRFKPNSNWTLFAQGISVYAPMGAWMIGIGKVFRFIAVELGAWKPCLSNVRLVWTQTNGSKHANVSFYGLEHKTASTWTCKAKQVGFMPFLNDSGTAEYEILVLKKTSFFLARLAALLFKPQGDLEKGKYWNAIF